MEGFAVRTQASCPGHTLLFITGIPSVSPDTRGPIVWTGRPPGSSPHIPRPQGEPAPSESPFAGKLFRLTQACPPPQHCAPALCSTCALFPSLVYCTPFSSGHTVFAHLSAQTPKLGSEA